MAISEDSVNDVVGRELTGKFLTFFLGSEEYGVKIMKVQEIIRMQQITAVPRTPDYVRGMINLRGRVIPVIELRTKFGMEKENDSEKTCIVVVHVHAEDKKVVVGIIIDDVREVRDLLPSDIENTPAFGMGIANEFIMGIGKLSERVIMLLDIDKVLTEEELHEVATIKINKEERKAEAVTV